MSLHRHGAVAELSLRKTKMKKIVMQTRDIVQEKSIYRRATVNVGVVAWIMRDAMFCATDLLKKAGEAMYAAKRKGRNRSSIRE